MNKKRTIDDMRRAVDHPGTAKTRQYVEGPKPPAPKRQGVGPREAELRRLREEAVARGG